MTGKGPSRVAIVQRQRPHVYEMLQLFARRNFIDLRWDRREGDRRHTGRAVALERRREDRRREPPAVWSSLGFMLLPRRAEIALPTAVRISA